ncbi:MAG: flagellar basal body P-ring formation chaperone FlgA [bacterium]
MKTLLTIAISCIIFAANAATITVRPTAEVNSQVIRLVDVAEYSCSDAEKLSFDKVTVGMINEPGDQKIITLGKIKIGLAQCGIDYNKQVYIGADKVTVLRKTADVAVTDNLTKSAQEWLQNKMKDADEDVELTLASSPNLSYSPAGEWTVTFNDSASSNSNRIVQATIIKASTVIWKGNYSFSIHRFAMVLTADKQIPRGTEIKSSDLVLTRKEITNISSTPVINKDIIGVRASTAINAGDIITKSNTDKMPVVLRNSRVSIKASCGVMVISTIAVAMEDGAMDEIIRVENPDTHQQYYAQVKGSAVLEIVR